MNKNIKCSLIKYFYSYYYNFIKIIANKIKKLEYYYCNNKYF